MPNAHLMGNYRLTIGQSAAFPIAVGHTDTQGLDEPAMETDYNVPSIIRPGTSGSHTYAICLDVTVPHRLPTSGP